VTPAERLTYSDNVFDAVFFMDILHHVDIPATMKEIRRVLNPARSLSATNCTRTHGSSG